jgi:hypothetical protein
MGDGRAKATQQEEAPFLQLPHEVWQGIISNLKYAQDLQALASSCRSLQSLVMSFTAQMTIVIDATQPEAPLKYQQHAAPAVSSRPPNASLELTLVMFKHNDVSEQSQQKALSTALKQLGQCPGVWSLRLKV